MNTLEKNIARQLVKRLLEKKYMISIFDSEEFTVRRSTDFQEIIDALGTTDYDMIRVWERTDDRLQKVGHFDMIWGNRHEVIGDIGANWEKDLETLCEIAKAAVSAAKDGFTETRG